MKTSEKIGEITKALAAAQGEFTNPERNRTVRVATKAKEGKPAGSYTFDYATFDNILAATRPILAKHALAVIQGVSTKENHVTVTTRVAHSSGEWYEDEITGAADNADIQAIGSTCTYLKRYSYTAMLNIAAEEDDDGVAGAGNDAEKFDRDTLPNCPKCKTNKSVIVGKAEYGGGFVCFAKKGGCGEKWQPETEPLPDTDLPDDRRRVDPPKGKKPPKSEPPKVDESKFSTVLAAATDPEGVGKILAQLDAKPVTSQEKQPLYYMALSKLLSFRLDRPAAMQARESICAKKQAEMLGAEDYQTLIYAVDAMLDKMPVETAA